MPQHVALHGDGCHLYVAGLEKLDDHVVVGNRLAAVELPREQRIADRLGRLVEGCERALQWLVLRGIEDGAMEVPVRLQVPCDIVRGEQLGHSRIRRPKRFRQRSQRTPRQRLDAVPLEQRAQAVGLLDENR